MKSVYLFSRCSTAIQATDGDSLRRQTDSTLAWISRDFPDWEISDRSFTLAGVSAYDGSALGLGGFIAACERGEIVSGKSVLAIEAPDRLSRLDPDETRQLWRTIQKKHGVDIAVTRWGIVFKHDESVGLGNDLMLTAAFHLARMESEQKSHRIRATIEKRRNDSRVGGKKRTSVAPAWLTLNKDRTEFVADKSKVAVLKRIFDLKLNSDLGPDAIARIFTDEKLETLRGGSHIWSRTIIRNYLTSPAVIGHFQPQTSSKVNGKRKYEDVGDVIKDYYPAVIDEDIFYATQKTFKTSTQGRKGNYTNLLRGMAVCPLCGSAMSTRQGLRSTGKKISLKCSVSMKNNTCNQSQVPYQQIEDTIVSVLSILDYSRIGGGSTSGRASKLQDKLDGLRLRRDATDERISKEMDTMAMASEGIKKRLITRVNAMDEELNLINQDIAATQTEILAIATPKTLTPNLDLTDYESRKEFNSFISNYVETIEPKEDRLRITFKASQEGAVILYGTDPEQVVKMLYKNPDSELAFDYGEDFGDMGKGW